MMQEIRAAMKSFKVFPDKNRSISEGAAGSESV